MKILNFTSFLILESDKNSLDKAKAFSGYVISELIKKIKSNKDPLDVVFHPKCQVFFVPKESEFVEGSFDMEENLIVKCDLGRVMQRGNTDDMMNCLRREQDDIEEVLIHEWTHLVDYEKNIPDVFREPKNKEEYYNLRSEVNAYFFGLVQKNIMNKDFNKFSSTLKDFLKKEEISPQNKKRMLVRAYKLWDEIHKKI